MPFVTKHRIVVALAAFLLAAPTFAHAQDPAKVRVTFGAGTSAGAIDGELALNLSAGYRFSKLFSFDVEAIRIDGSDNEFSIGPLNYTNLFPDISRMIPNPGDLNFNVSNDGNTYLATMGFRFEVPTNEGRFHPYVSGGMGFARTENNYDVRIATTTGGAPNGRNQPQTILPTPIYDASSHIGVVFGGGVGAQIRVWKGLSLGGDARYYRLDRGRNLGTFGGSVSYGF